MLKAIGEAVIVVGQGLASFTAELCCTFMHAVVLGVIIPLTFGSMAFGAWGLLVTATSCRAQVTYLTELLPRIASKPVGAPAGHLTDRP